MTIASKLTKSVRQAKVSAANEQDAAESGAVAPTPPASKPAPTTKKPTARTKSEPEAPVAPIPSRRVWPD